MSAARLRTLATVAVSVALVAPARAAAGQPPTTVVVAPFTNLSRQPADDWIGAGIAETIAADLRSAGLTVIGHGLVERMRTGNGNRNGNGERGTPEPDAALEAYRQRGVTWLVDGTLQRVADQLRITTRVVDVASGGVGFSTRVDGALSDLFDLQDEIAAALATRLSTAAGEPEARPERNVTGALTFGGAGGGGAAPRRDTTRNAPGGGGFAPTRQDRPMATVGRTTTPPQIDGRLDDAVWETATHITDFIQIAPVEGAPGSEATEVWIAYDGDYLYFAFYAHYARPEIMRVNRADREEIRGDDRMSVLFDPFLDQQRAYQLEVNGYGVQGDSLVNADGGTGFSRSSASSSVTRGNSGSRRRGGSGMTLSGQFGIRGDQSWNALFDTGGQIVADGWTAEMRIPFKSLRYPSRAPGQEHRWGFQITRIIRDKSEAQTWAPISRGVAGQLTQFGVLTGMSDLSRSRNLEFLPELTGLRFGALDTETGAFATGDPLGDLGVGVKYGLTPNLTADITFNPDFSQIESDRPQIETNQRFDLFYPEQRPFFLEGQEIFQTSTPLTLVHTRTIVDPRFGGKLTGKVGRTTLGVVVADDEAAGRLDDAAHPQYGASAQTVLGRARYDFYAESYLGAIMTAREFGEDYNRVAGVDGRFRLDRTHRVSFLAVRAETRDGTRSFSGPAFEVDFSKQGRNLSYNVAHSSIDPDFATSTGFLPRDDLRQTSGTVSYRWWPESTLMTWGPSVTYLRLYDHAGVLQDEQLPEHDQLLVPQQHGHLRDGQPRSRALRGGGFPEDRLRFLRRRERADPLGVRRLQLGRRHPLLEQPLPRAIDPRERQRAVSAHVPAAHRAHHDLERLHRPGGRRRRLQCQDLPDADHVPVHRTAAVAPHRGAQHAIGDGRQQRPVHLPHQRRHGGVPRLRRPLPARHAHRQPPVSDNRAPADQPGRLRQDLVLVPLLNRAGAAPTEREGMRCPCCFSFRSPPSSWPPRLLSSPCSCWRCWESGGRPAC